MRWLCHHRLSHAVALVLLLWTAVDLSNSSLCSLDNESLVGVTGAGLILTVRADDSLPVDAPFHVDDCFCCSHCVEPSLHPSVTVVMDIVVRDPLPAGMAPVGFGSPLYHPPHVSLQ
jgi:hypothetical protein